MWPKSLRCSPPSLAMAPTIGTRADLVPLAHRDAVGGEAALRSLGLSGPIVAVRYAARGALGRRFGRHQELLAVAGLHRQRGGDVGHRDVVVAFVVLDQLAEQVDSRRDASASVMESANFATRWALTSSTVGNSRLGERLPRGLFDRLEQVALARGDEQQRGSRTARPGRCVRSDARRTRCRAGCRS